MSSSKLTFVLIIIVVYLYTSTFAENELSQNYSENDTSEDINQNITTEPIELITKLIIIIIKELEMNGKTENGTKLGMPEGTENDREIEMNENFGNETIRMYEDHEMNLTNLVKPIIRDVIIEIKKQLAKKEPALSLFGAIQRVTGDFWITFVNTVKTINNFFDALFAPLLIPLQPKLTEN
ncbi:hypothetical protein QQG55_46785 [Brugia pahangi]